MVQSPVIIQNYSNGNEFYQEYKSLLNKSKFKIQFIIDTILDPYRVPDISVVNGQERIQKDLAAILILLNNKNISQKEYDNFMFNLKNIKHIFDIFGDWDLINKLNTNYTACAYLILHFLYDYSQQHPEIQKEIELILDNLISNKDNPDYRTLVRFLDTLITKNPTIQQYIYNNYIMLDPHKFIIRNLIQTTTTSGEIAENTVIDYLINLGFKLLYQGGNGSLPDQKFQIDAIFKSPTGQILGVQIKKAILIRPITLPYINPDYTYYCVEHVHNFENTNSDHYDLLIMIDQNGNIIGFEKQRGIQYNTFIDRWRYVSSQEPVFPTTQEFVIADFFDQICYWAGDK